jgi:hypothetical protein
MTIFWTTRRACTACGKKAKTRLRTDRVGSFCLSYGLCDDCATLRLEQTGTDLLPIDGSQKCFYCEQPAQHVSENQGVLLASRRQRAHYTCNGCQGRQKTAFQKAVARFRSEHSNDEALSAEVVLEMDREILAGL